MPTTATGPTPSGRPHPAAVRDRPPGRTDRSRPTGRRPVRTTRTGPRP
jgi:hypothetical protein